MIKTYRAVDQRSFELSKEIERRKRRRSMAYIVIPMAIIVSILEGYWAGPEFALMNLLLGAVFGFLAVRGYSGWIADVEAEKAEWDQYIKPGDRA